MAPIKQARARPVASVTAVLAAITAVAAALLLPASVIVLKIDSWRLAFDGPFEQSENRVLRIRVEQPNGAQIRLAGLEQVQPVGLCGRSRVFVRINLAGVERLEFRGRQESTQRLS